MEQESKRKLSRREFVGASAALLGAAVVPASAKQKRKKPEAQKPPPAPPVDEELEKALKELREFSVAEGTEPAFAFRAEWGWQRR